MFTFEVCFSFPLDEFTTNEALNEIFRYVSQVSVLSQVGLAILLAPVCQSVNIYMTCKILI